MKIKSLLKLIKEGVGVITCLSESQKEKLRERGYTVEEIETPCGCSGNQSVSA